MPHATASLAAVVRRAQLVIRLSPVVHLPSRFEESTPPATALLNSPIVRRRRAGSMQAKRSVDGIGRHRSGAM